MRSNLWGGYVQGRRQLGALTLQGGLRYDEARMVATQALPFSQRLTAGNHQRDRYGSGYLLATWYPGEDSSLFVGLGQGARLPTGAERYLQGSASFFRVRAAGSRPGRPAATRRQGWRRPGPRR